MTQRSPDEAIWKGSADLWLDAAYTALVEGGVDAVRIMPLAKRFGVSRTSFYWFFRDRDALLSALTERWRALNTGNFVGRTQAYADTIAEALLNVFDCWLDGDLFDARLEIGVRSWALDSIEVAALVAAADETRIAALAAMFIRFDYDPLAADVRARTVYLTQIGYMSMKTKEDLTIRMRRIPLYIKIFTGQLPKDREMNRFFARHGFAQRQNDEQQT